MLGKTPYEFSLKWDTVQQTLDKIRQFADEVEQNRQEAGEWDFSTHKGEVPGVKSDFEGLMIAISDGAKYHQLRQAILAKGGRASVACDWHGAVRSES
jgi:hypothetical protein